jgi:Xaa-Pro aminopeptidase
MKPEIRQARSSEETHSLRRRHKRLLEQMQPRSVAVIFAGARGASYPAARADQNVAYLTGLDEPDVVAVFHRSAQGDGGASADGAQEGRAYLFKRDRDRHYELWNGPMLSLGEARAELGFDAVHDIKELEHELAGWLVDVETLYLDLRGDSPLGSAVQRAMDKARVRCHGAELRETWGLMSELRMIKDDYELRLLERAAAITSEGHRAAMTLVRPGMTEAVLQAELEAVFKRGGATGLGYQSIVASGANACCLHYTRNSCGIAGGDLVLIDAGASYLDYTADVTRTFPASGRFSPEQALVYDIVLEVQLACLAAVQPGASHHELQILAASLLCDKLHQAGLLDQSATECFESGDYKRFYGHSLGHWLGRDVHDLGPSYRGNRPRPFEPGHVLTIEPGLYFQLYDERVPEAFRGIGIRIEDDVVVTAEGGCRVLTDVVKSRDAIEALMAAGGRVS